MTKHFQETQREFCAHIRNPKKNPTVENIEARRLKIYSDLLYNNVENFVARAFPVTKKLFGSEKWHKMVRDFFEHHQSESPYFFQIAEEFLNYLQYERCHSEDSSEDPEFLLDLAHYEWVELALEVSQISIPNTGFNPEGDLLKGQIVVSPLAWVLHYQWPVHHIAPDFLPEAKQACFLVMYRNEQDAIRFLEINAISARLMTLIQESTLLTGNQVIEVLHQELLQNGQDFPLDTLKTHARETLENLRKQGIILGTRLSSIK